MPVDISLNKSYALRNRDIFVSVTIGEGQFGTSDVLLEQKRILRASGPIGKLLLGKGDDLDGKTLTVRSVVNDVSTATNKMSVTYKLAGGKATEVFTAKGTVSQSGDLLVFEGNFSLALEKRP